MTVAPAPTRQKLCSVADAFSEKPVSYTHLRAQETVLDLDCRLLLDKKKHNISLAAQINNTHSPLRASADILPPPGLTPVPAAGNDVQTRQCSLV